MTEKNALQFMRVIELIPLQKNFAFDKVRARYFNFLGLDLETIAVPLQ